VVAVARVERRDAAYVGGGDPDVRVAVRRMQISHRVVPHHVLLLPHEGGRAHLRARKSKSEPCNAQHARTQGTAHWQPCKAPHACMGSHMLLTFLPCCTHTCRAPLLATADTLHYSCGLLSCVETRSQSAHSLLHMETVLCLAG
jgi:hypothetical protein